jgi:Protein of unknown function (DUF3455).
MNNFFRYFATAGVIAMALESSVALAQPSPPNAFTAPPIPANLEVPDGNRLFLMGQAQGTQNYICLPSATGFSWTFFSPQATVFITFPSIGRDLRQQIITHFLSPNPAESGMPRVTWQSSFDTSASWGRTRLNGSSTDPNFVAAGAIPWVLLEAVGTRRGPTGGDTLADTTFIQRLNTSGGVAPSTGCSQSSDVGATQLAPYTADYFFYKESEKN